MIKLITVGTIKEKYLKDAIDEYTKRIKKYTNIELIEVKDEGLVEESKAIALEADKIKNYKSIKRVKVENETSVQLLRRATGLDIGESEAIILSDQIKADLLLMDEVKGRQVARNMGINLMGTIGILMQAYDSRLLSKEEKSIFQKIKEVINIVINIIPQKTFIIVIIFISGWDNIFKKAFIIVNIAIKRHPNAQIISK